MTRLFNRPFGRVLSELCLLFYQNHVYLAQTSRFYCTEKSLLEIQTVFRKPSLSAIHTVSRSTVTHVRRSTAWKLLFKLSFCRQISASTLLRWRSHAGSLSVRLRWCPWTSYTRHGAELPGNYLGNVVTTNPPPRPVWAHDRCRTSLSLCDATVCA